MRDFLKQNINCHNGTQEVENLNNVIKWMK